MLYNSTEMAVRYIEMLWLYEYHRVTQECFKKLKGDDEDGPEIIEQNDNIKIEEIVVNGIKYCEGDYCYIKNESDADQPTIGCIFGI
jgi:hypothetical protein